MRAIIILSKEQNEDFDNMMASIRKEKKMDEMTDLQFKTLINAIIQIIRDNKDKEEMIKKIEALVNKN